MRDYDAATVAYLSSRRGIVSCFLVWIKARNLATNQFETLGLWTGVEPGTFAVDGETRTYVPADGALHSEPVSSVGNLEVRMHQLQMAAIAPEVEELIKAYDTRFAPIEMHRAFFDPETRQLVSSPHRVLRGQINKVDFPRAEVGGDPICTLEIASDTRDLTRVLNQKKSHSAQAARSDDQFRKYGDVSQSVPVYWGEKRVSTPE